MRVHTTGLTILPALLLAMPLFAQEPSRAAVIWQDRGDIAALDLAGASGGTERGPGTNFKFIKENTGGTSPKFDVEDENGTTWKVKLGEEAKSETAATRLLWVAGYVVEVGYYRPEIRVMGLPTLKRGRQFVSDGGIVSGARLERDTDDGSATWSWYDNPFIGTQEFNGLRVMMALINNWDLKEVNNGAPEASSNGGQYGITDLGATFGRTGDSFTRSKGDVQDYADTRFVEGISLTHVDLVMHSRPFLLSVFNLPNYRFRTRMESVAKEIPIADARWIGERLGQLSMGQVSDVFRTAGFSPMEVEGYTRVVMQRITTLKTLAPEIAVLPVRQADAESAAEDRAARCLESTCRQVPVRETLAAFKVGTPYARAILGGFEQGAAIGGGMQLTSAQIVPGVEFRATALISTERYRRFDFGAFLPNIGGSRNHADVWGSHLKRETDFYGIGPRTSTDVEAQFAVVQRSYQGSLYRDFAADLQGGVYAQVMNTQTSRGTDETLLPIDQSFSGTIGQAPARWIPGFGANPRILSYGVFLAYDSRDNSVGLTRGLNLFGRVASADGLDDRQAPTQYGWTEREFDLRGHVPLGGPRTSLLLRSRGQFKSPKEGGSQIPFYSLAWLGGRQYLRGYHSYRFRGNSVLLFATELQRTIRSMTPVRGIDVFATADTGQVWGDSRSSTDPEVLDNQAFDSSNWHSGLGGGIQYRHSRGMAGRVEISRGGEGSRVYAALSRGF